MSKDLATLIFLREKILNFCRVQMVYVHPFILNYLQYAKRSSNIIAR